MAFSVSLWNNLSDPVFVGVGHKAFKSRANYFLFAKFALSFRLVQFSSFLPSKGRLCGVGVFG